MFKQEKTLYNLLKVSILLFVIYRVYTNDHDSFLNTFWWAFFVLYGLFSPLPKKGGE